MSQIPYLPHNKVLSKLGPSTKAEHRSYSGPLFPSFGLSTERYGVSLRIQFKCRQMRTRVTPNTNAFHAVEMCLF